MAMAEVFIPEPPTEESFTAYPRAPPPSPELQPRGLKSIFEIPASKFEGALDLRTQDFDFSETVTTTSVLTPSTPSLNGFTVCSERSVYNGRRLAIEEEEEEENEWDSVLPGSPKKRPCSFPSMLPAALEVRDFYRSGSTDSRSSSLYVHPGSVSSCDGLAALNFSSESHSHSTESTTKSHSHSNSPQHYTQQHSCPIPQRGAGQLLPSSLSGSATPTHQLSPEHTLANHQQLSRSFDLHNVHPHLPLNFETTQLPEVRPARSHTLGATSYDDDPTLRKRKVSLKRRNEDIDSDPSLQFSFEYSYSSTGSSGDSDWVVVEHEASSYPQGKKACCQDTPTSVAMSRNSIFPAASSSSTTTNVGADTSPSLFLRGGEGQRTNTFTSESSQILTLPTTTLATFESSLLQTTPYSQIQPGTSHPPTLDSGFGSYMSSNLHEGPVHRLANVGPQMSIDSVTMMDCGEYGNRMDSLDSMDCGHSETQPQAIEMEGAPNSTHLYTNFQSVNGLSTQQQQSHFLYQPTTTQVAGPLTLDIGRSHSSEAGYSNTAAGPGGATARHSFMENYFVSYHEQQSEGVTSSDGASFGTSRFNFSKSL